MAFLEQHGIHPSNFGRVELYAGTPLLDRMRRDNRITGDTLAWDYRQATNTMQRIYELTLAAFYERNFSGHAAANRLQSTRFDAEVARWFHRGAFHSPWLDRAKTLSSRLARSSAHGVRQIVEYVLGGPLGSESQPEDEAFLARLDRELRECEHEIDQLATVLEEEIQTGVGARCAHAVAKPIPVARDGSHRDARMGAEGVM
jgi:hypothetical protein